ncbi:sugar transferase [Aquimarina spongiae]|uniref:Sugar transferase involved in LPS biosynthesis (Colanic, teichoic acid) n=1 Tax=Aquimarina spongiae TaxID=570521 RepID=A0A1M6AHJ9_9FLAO|nr:sugar transferase [Aquimarina spongiae]SHI35922.1 Sugar transferase involved in LPS biosynthesis (colanic, teichoic acid) [Aquimarina spongiae]
MYKSFLKRLIDFLASFFGIVLLSPIILFLIVFLAMANSGKPFFFQARPGRNERIFKIVKFKSMNDKKDENGELLPFEQRITKVGKFIRKYSLDEIPQLFNVLKGDMSLIGPRPLLVKYLPLYNDFQKRRHDVRPGITGWAQVNGRNTISWEEKFKLDVWYTEHISFITDMKILIRTIKKVLFKEDINSGQNLNMPTFTGNN